MRPRSLLLLPLLACAGFAQTPKGPFEIKSGIVEMTTDFMGEQKQTLYFDDYGRKQTLEAKTTVEMFGIKQSSTSLTITADGKTTTIDVEKKTGHRRSSGVPASTVPDPAALTAKKKADWNYQPLPDKEIAGKTCKGFSMEPMKGMPMKAWTWKGIPMLTITRVGNGLVTMTTTRLLEQDVPADKFKAPRDVQITDD